MPEQPEPIMVDRMKRVLAFADKRAKAFRHEKLEPEDLLWGLVEEGAGVAINLLRAREIEPRIIRDELNIATERGNAASEQLGTQPLLFSDAITRIIQLAKEEARGLHQNHFGTEHVLFGILGVPRTKARTILSMKFGIYLADMRIEYERMTNPRPPPQDPPGDFAPTT